MPITGSEASGENIPASLQRILRQPDIASEFFFPVDRATWREQQKRYFIKREDRRSVRSSIGGVRFQAANLAEPGSRTEIDCQHDFVRLVQSLMILRKQPELSGIVLSQDVLLQKQRGGTKGKRAKFGLALPSDGRFLNDVDAARENHRRIVRAIQGAGFSVIDPTGRFEPRTGMDGLQEWASNLRLGKRRNYWWILLLFVLLIPTLWLLRCEPTGTGG